VVDLDETRFPSDDPREWSRGVVGRSTTSPADCTVDDDDDVCTTPATSSETKNAEWWITAFQSIILTVHCFKDIRLLMN
jgi:hypothetical protein